MTMHEAILKADGMLLGIAGMELGKIRLSLIEQGYDDDQVEQALLQAKRDADEWRVNTLAELKRWFEDPDAPSKLQ